MDRVLWAMSRWNDKVQAALFDPNKLAPTYPESAVTDPFPFNAYYPESDVRTVDSAAWRLELSGLIADNTPWSLARLRALPQESQITRHVCVEGWSAIGRWSGVPFRTFLQRVGANTRARYSGFHCFDGYRSSIDTATALHPQTILALDYGDLPAAEIRVTAEAAGADQTRFQEPEVSRCTLRHQRQPGRLLGRPGLQLVQRVVTLAPASARAGCRETLGCATIHAPTRVDRMTAARTRADRPSLTSERWRLLRRVRWQSPWRCLSHSRVMVSRRSRWSTRTAAELPKAVPGLREGCRCPPTQMCSRFHQASK